MSTQVSIDLKNRETRELVHKALKERGWSWTAFFYLMVYRELGIDIKEINNQKN